MNSEESKRDKAYRKWNTPPNGSILNSLLCTIKLDPIYKESGLLVEFYRKTLPEINSVLSSLGITPPIQGDVFPITEQRNFGKIKVTVSIERVPYITQESTSFITIPEIKTNFQDMINKALLNSLRRTNMNKPIKSAKLPEEVYYIVVNGSRQYYEDYDEADDNLETLRAIGKGKVDGVYTETDPDEIYELYEVGYIGNSRKPVKSALNLEDTAQANVANNFNSKIFDYTWFDATNSDTTNYDLFIEDFTQWLIENGVNVNEYPNMDFDVGYYFKEFMNDPNANTSNAEAMYQQVYDWLEGEEEFMTSDQYLDDMYGNTSFTDDEFFTQDIDENARKQFQYGDTHGFKSAQDLVKAARECLDKLECYDKYDAGGMGYHAYDENNEWFETGCLFLGNGEEEWQLDPEVPFDEEYDFCDAYRHFCINRGCYMYAVSDRLYAYGVRWSDVEQKGDELGLRSEM